MTTTTIEETQTINLVKELEIYNYTESEIWYFNTFINKKWYENRKITPNQIMKIVKMLDNETIRLEDLYEKNGYSKIVRVARELSNTLSLRLEMIYDKYTKEKESLDIDSMYL